MSAPEHADRVAAAQAAVDATAAAAQAAEETRRSAEAQLQRHGQAMVRLGGGR